MDAGERLVWIDAEPAVDPSRAGALCRRHADALRPPRGWTLDDRRDEMPRLLRVPENGATVPERRSVARARPQRTRREPEVSVPDLFTDVPQVETLPDPPPDAHAVEPPTVDEATPDETRAIPWVPRLGGGVPDDIPRGRLLGRAFGRREPEGD